MECNHIFDLSDVGEQSPLIESQIIWMWKFLLRHNTAYSTHAALKIKNKKYKATNWQPPPCRKSVEKFDGLIGWLNSPLTFCCPFDCPYFRKRFVKHFHLSTPFRCSSTYITVVFRLFCTCGKLPPGIPMFCFRSPSISVYFFWLIATCFANGSRMTFSAAGAFRKATSTWTTRTEANVLIGD